MLLFVTLLPLIFHMAAAEIAVMLTSRSSGYVTVQNLSHSDPASVQRRTVSLSNSSAVMFSFQPGVSVLPTVSLRCRCLLPHPSKGHPRENSLLQVWTRSQYRSNFAHMCNTPTFTVTVLSKTCPSSSCFRLFFTAFTHTDTPERVPGGLWNCSAGTYPSFRHHLDCNLKRECEDGRDETGECPSSSPECAGMAAVCGRCYTLTWPMPDLLTSWTDMHELGSRYCRDSVRGALGVPTCHHDWLGRFRQVTKVRHALNAILLGLRVNAGSFPFMYKNSFVGSDGTVFYHTFSMRDYPNESGELCCYAWQGDVFCGTCDGAYDVSLKSQFGALCEVRTNRSGDRSYHPDGVSVRSTHGFPSQDFQSMAVCDDGHMTLHIFLCPSVNFQDCRKQGSFPCRFSSPLPEQQQQSVSTAPPGGTAVPTFPCRDEVTALSYSLVCDFRADCPDASDETFCRHPVCVNAFTCQDQQCVPYSTLCDHRDNCPDTSDEEDCQSFPCVKLWKSPSFPSPALINFDDKTNFIVTRMNVSESCPDSHYRCPGDFNDCLPVYTRCNGMHDCLDHQDEEGCEDLRCPGFFRCRLSKLCVHKDHTCDGWPHCPQRDDELLCDVTCPVGCLCQGHTFLCFQAFSVSPFPHLRSLDATGSGLTLSDIGHHQYLLHLVLVRCSLTLLPEMTVPNLRILDLSDNDLRQVNTSSFLSLGNLQSLSLSRNPLTLLHTPLTSDLHQTTLVSVDLSFTALTRFDFQSLAPFPHLQKLNLTFTSIHTITSEGFHFLPQVREIHLAGSPIKTFPPGVFKKLLHLRVIDTQNYKLCCDEILPHGVEGLSCRAPKDEVSSCEDLLESWSYRGFLWLTACLSVTGNVFCLCARLTARSLASRSGFSVLVTNLTLADLLMGVYIVFIGVADERYRGNYLHHDDTWKSSIPCQVAGFLCLLSSEVSAVIICLITLDRFIVLTFPFSNLRFEPTSASAVCLVTWMVGFLLALIPLLPVTSHWEFYSQAGICIPLPVTRQAFRGRFYSFGVLIVFNFVLFLLISSGQAFIYWSIQKNTLKTNTTKVSRDMTIARRLITVAATDFLCWFPVGLCGILALTGVPIPGEMNVGLAIFVLPLNSAINPFMYTFNILTEKRRTASREKLLRWMESYLETS